MKLADFLPAPVRKTIYTALGTVVALEAIFDVIPDVLEGKALQALTVLGFGLAVSKTADR